MVRKLASMLIIGGMFAVAACNTVRGVGNDLGSAANCTENTMNGGKC